MKAPELFKALLAHLLAIDKKTLAAIGEDLRKVGVTGISAGLIGLVVTGDTITLVEAKIVLLVGAIIWLYGILLTSVSNK